MKKLFVVRKYIMAESASDAIRKESKQKVDDVWVDEEWKKVHTEEDTKNIGFKK
jgi:hypothetical protein